MEVCLLPGCTAAYSEVEAALRRALKLTTLPYRDGRLPLSLLDDEPSLHAVVAHLAVADTAGLGAAPLGSEVYSWAQQLHVFVYQLNEDAAGVEEDEEEDGAAGVSYRDWALPATEFGGAWEALVYDSDVKARLLRYCTAALRFADARVDAQLVSFNRVVLLHGPPGTGKTSLCCALAQKLSIRFGSRFSSGVTLVEVNAHSLFSRWFSESGKLVGKLFAKVGELLEDPDALVCLLIDEVESLSASRSASANGVLPREQK